MKKTDLRTLHTAVWQFRNEMADDFPTPGRNDSLAFALTEAAEAVDAELRLNPLYKRNALKEHSIEQELTQCVIMLLTAISSSFRAWADLDLYETITVWNPRTIGIRVAHCLETPGDTSYILQTVAIIGATVDLTTTLPAELERWKAKHKPYSGTAAGWHMTKLERITYPQTAEQLIIADYNDGAGV